MNKRQSSIIDILHDQGDWITGKELSKFLNVSDRTIRSDIEKINRDFSCDLIIANRRLGYHLDEVLLLNKGIKPKMIIPQTVHERTIWIIRELLFNDKELNLIELQDRIFVSGYSIENDLKRIKKMVSEYPNLKIVRSKNRIRLEGDESVKRKLYKHLLNNEIQGNFMNLNALSRFWGEFDLLRLADCFDEITSKYKYEIREEIYPIVIIHLGIAVDRIINHNFINSYEDLNYGDWIEYKLAKELFVAINKLIGSPYVEGEVIGFAGLLRGKREGKDSFYKDTDQIVDSILTKIKKKFDVDLRDDQDLRNGLELHINSLIERLRHDMKVTNIYLREIKRKYPLVFEMAITAGQIIAEKVNREVNENEVAFLALHLGVAYERYISIAKYRAVAIIPHSGMLSGACIDKIKLHFEDRLQFVKVLRYFEEKQIENLKPDLIITTIPIHHDLDILTVQVGLFFNNEDESKIFQALNSLDKIKYRDTFEKSIKALLREELCFFKQKINNREEAIDFLCDQLVTRGLATKEYKEDVLKRERLSSTSFVHGFAVPHAIQETTKESSISTMILDKPIKWGDFEVRLIILLSIQEPDGQLLQIIFEWLTGLVTDAKRLAAMLEAKNYQELLKIMVE